MGKNFGTEKAPDLLIQNGKEVLIHVSHIDETMKVLSETTGDFFVGGDHSISYGSFKGFAREFKNPGIIVFDAHPDCYPDDFVNHENWVYHLINEKVLKKENIILIGLRLIDQKELEFLCNNKIKYFLMGDLFKNEKNVCDTVLELVREFDALYLSVDIDVLDPVFAPGTGYLEVGGMNLNQLIYFLNRIKTLRNLRRIDLVEINPDKDVNGVTVKLGRKIIEIFL